MRSYRNHVWDLIDNLFDAFCITAIPREQNQQADALATAASTLRPPPLPKLKHEVEMRFRPSITDNVRHWQAFEDDQQIKRFLEAVEYFSNTIPDLENNALQEDQRDETGSVPNSTFCK